MSRNTRKNARTAAAIASPVKATRPARTAATVTADPATVAAAHDALSIGPRVSITLGTNGRASAAELAVRDAAYGRLAAIVAAAAKPAALSIPRGVSPRVAAAMREDHAFELAADTMLRAAVAAGRVGR